jgi:hypothetical protein
MESTLYRTFPRITAYEMARTRRDNPVRQLGCGQALLPLGPLGAALESLGERFAFDQFQNLRRHAVAVL